MAAIIPPIHADELQISIPRIRELIDTCRERRRTGVIRLGYPAHKCLHLLIKRGGLLNAYLVSSGACVSLPGGQWEAWMESAGDAFLKIVPLSPFGLLVSKLLITSTVQKTESFSEPARLSEYISTLQQNRGAILAHFNWRDAMGGVLSSGPGGDAHSIFLSQETIVDEPGVNRIFSQSNEAQCVVRTCIPDPTVDAWQEYHLRRFFAVISSQMLVRIETMTGRALIDSLIRLIAIYASRNNVDIIVTPNKLTDHEVFSSPELAAQTYRRLLNEMFTHLSAVVGPRLLALTLRDILMGFAEHERAVIRNFELFPEGYSYE